MDYPPEALELIVIDGGSTDGTPGVIERYAPRLGYRVSEPDRGLYDAMNKGLRASTGDYVWFVNAGDEPFADDTLKQIFTNDSPDRDLCDIYYGEAAITSPTGDVQPHRQSPSDSKDDKLLQNNANGAPLPGKILGLRRKPLPRGGLTWRSLRRGMVVCHQSFIVRRTLAPMYDTEHYQLAADIEWVIECLKRASGVCNTGLILSKFAEGGVSTRRRRESLRERWRIMRRHYGLRSTLWAHIRFVWESVFRRGYRPLP